MSDPYEGVDFEARSTAAQTQWLLETPAGWLRQQTGYRDAADVTVHELRQRPDIDPDTLTPGRVLQHQLAERSRRAAQGDLGPQAGTDVDTLVRGMRARQAASQLGTMMRNPDGSTSYAGTPEQIHGMKESVEIARARVQMINANTTTIYPHSNGVAGPS